MQSKMRTNNVWLLVALLLCCAPVAARQQHRRLRKTRETAFPTSGPSSSTPPSVLPTLTPSTPAPTDLPTNEPTNWPSQEPSTPSPTDEPTLQPSTSPGPTTLTREPSIVASYEPTLEPTVTKSPSMAPSSSPAPSNMPSAVASMVPTRTAGPTVTPRPTAVPTATRRPTSQPTVTVAPSAMKTSLPLPVMEPPTAESLHAVALANFTVTWTGNDQSLLSTDGLNGWLLSALQPDFPNLVAVQTTVYENSTTTDDDDVSSTVVGGTAIFTGDTPPAARSVQEQQWHIVSSQREAFEEAVGVPVVRVVPAATAPAETRTPNSTTPGTTSKRNFTWVILVVLVAVVSLLLTGLVVIGRKRRAATLHLSHSHTTIPPVDYGEEEEETHAQPRYVSPVAIKLPPIPDDESSNPPPPPDSNPPGVKEPVVPPLPPMLSKGPRRRRDDDDEDKNGPGIQYITPMLAATPPPPPPPPPPQTEPTPVQPRVLDATIQSSESVLSESVLITPEPPSLSTRLPEPHTTLNAVALQQPYATPYRMENGALLESVPSTDADADSSIDGFSLYTTVTKATPPRKTPISNNRPGVQEDDDGATNFSYGQVGNDDASLQHSRICGEEVSLGRLTATALEQQEQVQQAKPPVVRSQPLYMATAAAASSFDDAADSQPTDEMQGDTQDLEGFAAELERHRTPGVKKTTANNTPPTAPSTSRMPSNNLIM